MAHTTLIRRLAQPLRRPAVVLISLPLLVLAVALFFMLTNEHQNREILVDLSRERMVDQNLDVALRVSDVTALGERTTATAQAIVERYLADGNQEALTHAFSHLLGLKPAMTRIYFGSAEGHYTGVELEAGVGAILDQREPNGRQLVSRLAVGQGLIEHRVDPAKNYNSTHRDWFRAALDAGTVTWTEPYLMFTEQVPGVSCTLPIYAANNSLRAVLAFDLELGPLSQVLSELGADRELDGLRAVILTEDGQVLACDSPVVTPESVVGRIATADNIGDPAIAEFWKVWNVQRLQGSTWNGSFAVPTPDGATNFIGEVTTVSVGPQEWHVARFAPLNEVMAPADGSIMAGRVVAAIGAVVSIAFAILYALALVDANNRIQRAEAMAAEAEESARQIGSYKLVKQLGAGGMGEVWLVSHRFLARPAAMKFIKTSDQFDAEEVIERFRREAQALSMLRSRHTIQVYDFGVSADGRFFYVMELLDGLDLEELVMQGGVVDPARVVDLLIQSCHSLAEAHDQGLIHRDIKPGNIFLCRQADDLDVVKVLDFGLVIPRSAQDRAESPRLTQEGLVQGTPDYMAPEQAQDQTVDGRTDLYALGCVAFWLLTGKPPYDGLSPLDILMSHVQDPIPSVSERSPQPIPPVLDQIVAACMAKSPDDRPRDARMLAAMLESSAVDPGQWNDERKRQWWADRPEIARSCEEQDCNEIVVPRRRTL